MTTNRKPRPTNHSVTNRARAWLRYRKPGERFTISECCIALGISNDAGRQEVTEAFAWCVPKYVRRDGDEFVTAKEGIA